jgi:signal transduction histidine kinase
MPISLAVLGLVFTVSIAFLAWERNKLLRRLGELANKCQDAKIENSRLEGAISLHNRDEVEGISQLEHDLRSSISVIAGFSALLHESFENDSKPQHPFLLKAAGGIHQATAKCLQILDAAAAGEYLREPSQSLTVESNHQVLP